MSGFYDANDDGFWVNEDAGYVEDQDAIVVEEEGGGQLQELESFIIDEKSSQNYLPGTECLEVVEEEPQSKETNWADDGDHSKFIAYVRDRMGNIPRHSGETVSGCERAKSYIKHIRDHDISKAMRSDHNGLIDEQQVDAIRKEIDGMIEQLDRKIKQLSGSKKHADINARIISHGHCDKCDTEAPMWHDVGNHKLVCMSCEAEEQDDGELSKTATTPSVNVYMNAFEQAVVATIINSTVSAGRNIEETYEKLKNKYNFTPREELALQQLIANYGYPIHKDRGLLNEEADPTASTGVDFQTNYYA